MSQPLTRLLTTPLGELFDEDDIDVTLRALARVVSSYRSPSHDLSLRQVLPAGVERATKRLVGLRLVPDGALVRRLLDHRVSDRFVSELVTRILAGYATQQGASTAPGRSLLARVPLTTVSSSLTDSVAAGIERFASTQHDRIIHYLIDTLTAVEHLPEFAEWRTHVVDVIWETPLADVLPSHQPVVLQQAGRSAAEVATELREGLADRSMLDILCQLGFDRDALTSLAGELDRALVRG